MILMHLVTNIMTQTKYSQKGRTVHVEFCLV